MGDRQAEGMPPSFKQLFGDQEDDVRREALSAAEAIESAAEQLIVRRLLARTRRIEMAKRLRMEWQQDDWPLRRDARRAVKSLERLMKYFDPPLPPEPYRQAFEWVRSLARPSAEQNKKGRPSMPHYLTALEQMAAMKIDPESARAMLRGIGIFVRPPDPGN